MDEETQEFILPADPVASRAQAVCNLAAQLDQTRDKEARKSLLAMMEAVRLSILPNAPRASVTPIKGGKTN